MLRQPIYLDQSCSSADAALPAGYIRQADLIGQRPITPQQAEERRARKRPCRPRDGKRGLLPWSSATLWRKVKAGEFPAPVKLSPGVTAWDLSAVMEWIESRAAASSQVIAGKRATPVARAPANR